MKLAAGLLMMVQADLNVVPAEFHTEQSKFSFVLRPIPRFGLIVEKYKMINTWQQN